MKQDFPIILASSSPRRRELMNKIGYEFQAKSFNFDETLPENLPAMEAAHYLCESKMDQISDKKPNHIYITVDTVVILEESVMGKPRDIDEARTMIKQLSNKQHLVMSAVCLEIDTIRETFNDTCEVHFNELTDQDIEYYISHFSVLDKAGAYGIQDWIGMVGVHRIHGSFYTVMGLPVHKLYQHLSTLQKRKPTP